MKKLTIFLFVLLFIIPNGCSGDDVRPALAYTMPPEHAVVRAVLGEAENQGYNGMLAVACGVRNRPEGLDGVRGCRSNRYELANRPERILAHLAYFDSLNPRNCEFIRGADMWCSDLIKCRKKWRGVPMIFKKKVKDHYFFRRITNGGRK